MVDTSAIYIASVSGGKCIENTQQAKGECRLRKWNKSSAQQWTVEASEENPNTVAFKSIVDQQYLAALQPDKRNGGKIGVQTEKQWWTLEPGRGPNLFHVKSNSSFGGGKAGYLNDEWGRIQDDNKIQTYQYEANNPGFNTFYFSTPEVADKQILHLSSAADDGEDGKKNELDAREKELSEREKAVTEKEQDHTEQEKDLQKKEAALAQREKELAKREQNTKAASVPTQEDDSGRTKALEAKEAALAKREEEVQRREDELASGSAAAEQDDGVEEPSGTEQYTTMHTNNGEAFDEDVHELCLLQRENDSLKAKLKIGELEAKLREGACQHKIKRPPRKIDHRVVGYVYR